MEDIVLKIAPVVVVALGVSFGVIGPVHAGAGHGSAGATPEAGHSEGMEMAFGRPGDPAKVTRTVTLEAREIAFDKQSMEFKAGEIVRFVLVNKGEQDHELTIADPETQVQHRQMMAEMPASMDHSQMEGHGHAMHGNSVSAKPGETKELVWEFTKPGTFEFACNFPGHAEVGMAGKLKVE